MNSRTLDWYLQEIGKRKLLSPEEETQKFREFAGYKRILYAALDEDTLFIDGNVSTAQRLETESDLHGSGLQKMALQYLTRIDERLQVLVLSEEYCSEIEHRKDQVTASYTCWNNAKNQLIEANLRLVVSVAKRFRRDRFSFEVLIREGNHGLSMAVDGFDAERGTKFSTYATNWIEGSIKGLNRKAVPDLLSLDQSVKNEEGKETGERYNLVEDTKLPRADRELAVRELQVRMIAIISKHTTEREYDLIMEHLGLGSKEIPSQKLSADDKTRIFRKLRRIPELQGLYEDFK